MTTNRIHLHLVATALVCALLDCGCNALQSTATEPGWPSPNAISPANSIVPAGVSIRVLPSDMGPARGDIGGFEGTSVDLLLLMPNALIITVLSEGSSITELIDSANHDLLQGKPGHEAFWTGGYIDTLPSVSTDGHHCLLTVGGPGVPGTGATSIKVSGELKVQYAEQKVTVRKENFKITQGSVLDMGDVRFEVVHVGDLSAAAQLPGLFAPSDLKKEDSGQEVTIRAGMRERDALVDVRLLNEHGDKIGSPIGKLTSGNDALMIFACKGQHSTVTIEMTKYESIGDVVLPFNFEVGLGSWAGK